MTTTVRLILAAAVCCAGIWVVVNGLSVPRPPLGRMVAHLGRRPVPPVVPTRRGGVVARVAGSRAQFRDEVLTDLRLVQRLPETHAAMLVGAGVAGLFGPAALVVILQVSGALGRDVLVPLGLALGGAAVAPWLVHVSMRQRAAEIRHDLRYQLSSYLDVVTMLLAGNVGNEGALRQAALAGDGRLFSELRQRILAAETANRSLVSALAALGDDLRLTELQQISASAALGSVAGAPVARSLTAKCATLRAALAAEQEAEARVRTGRITVPLVGMSLLIMTAVIYPALAL